MDDNLYQTLQMAIDTIEDVIKDITSKKDINPAQLEHLSKAVCIIEKLKSMQQQENSYRRGRSRYMNSNNYYDGNSGRNYRGSGNSSRRYNDANGYSGHSIKDKMIAKLEEMFDDAQSNHEKQVVQDWLDRLSHDF